MTLPTNKDNQITFVSFKIKLTGDSSVGRAVDCRSIGRVFDSPSPDLK